MTSSRRILRVTGPIFALAAFAGIALALAPPAAAESAVAPPLAPASLDLAAPDGAGDAELERGVEVVFTNEGVAAARIVFARRDAARLGCRPDGRRAVRSRPGQFMLEAGAELTCAPRRGTFEYTAYVQRDGAVREERGRVRVR